LPRRAARPQPPAAYLLIILFLSQGETDIEDGGRIVAAALTVAAAGKKERDIISFVDLVAGVEFQRSEVTEKMVVADLEFCDAKL
jgi:hypothetical protein